jgi:hypothetical protein
MRTSTCQHRATVIHQSMGSHFPIDAKSGCAEWPGTQPG